MFYDDSKNPKSETKWKTENFRKFQSPKRIFSAIQNSSSNFSLPLGLNVSADFSQSKKQGWVFSNVGSGIALNGKLF